MSIDDSNKPKRGRPPVDTAPVHVRMPSDLIAALDDYRREQEDLPGRPEAARRILTDWLRERGYLPK